MVRVESVSGLVSQDAALKPSLKDFRQKLRFKSLWYIRCVAGTAGHFFGSQLRYTGTGRNGTSWRVCSRCGHAKLYALIRS
jgi:hypothetical protein